MTWRRAPIQRPVISFRIGLGPSKEPRSGRGGCETHPVVRTHPETGRKALFVSRAFVVGLADMTTQESEPLLSFLYSRATSPDLTMRHAWQKGDLVIWDNRSVQHYAVHDYGDAPRTMHRVTVIGDEPR